MITVKRRDITVRNETMRVDYGIMSGATRFEETDAGWVAKFNGRLSTGEHVELERYGTDFEGALNSLEVAIAKVGWEITDENS